MINHTITKGTVINRLNSTKNSSSARVYPLNTEQVAIFEYLKEREAENHRLFESSYKENDYVFKHTDGSLYYPDYPSKTFGKIIRAHPELPQDINMKV